MPTPSLAPLFCVGASGLQLSDDDKRVLGRGVGGLVLFSRNVDTPDQVASLITDARAIAGSELLVCVDQEGGNTVRLERGFTRLPSMRAVGRAPGDRAAIAHEIGQCLGQELREVGFDMDFAPVLDVDTNPDNPVIGERSFSADPNEVALLGQHLIEGLHSQGIIACGKHFPGHGDTHQDSHHELPRLPHRMERMEAVELLPFRRVLSALADLHRQGALAIMTAHVIFEAIHPDLPGTLCPDVLTNLLRDQLGFRGLCISDCMEMKAIADGTRWDGTVGAAVAGLQAGIDMPLICHTHAVMLNAIDAAERAYQEGELAEARVREALAHLESCRAFRRAQQDKSFPWFEPSAAFQSFLSEAADAGEDPTWEGVGA